MTKRDFLIFYIHETREFLFHELSTDFLYIGGVNCQSLQWTDLTSCNYEWERYLINKGIRVTKSQLLTLPVSIRDITPIMTMKKTDTGWKFQHGIPNHFLGNHTIIIDGNQNNYYRDWIDIESNSVITITAKGKAGPKPITLLLSPSDFFIDIFGKLGDFHLSFSVGRKKEFLFSFSSRQPFNSKQIEALISAFEILELSKVRESQRERLRNYKSSLNPKHKDVLEAMGYWRSGQLVSNLHEIVGSILFKLLFCEQLQKLVSIFLEKRIRIGFDLNFSEDDTLALSYPWELFSINGFFPSFTEQIMIKRVLGVASGEQRQKEGGDVKILFIDPNPRDGESLPKREIVEKLIRDSQGHFKAVIDKDEVKTWEVLKEKILHSTDISIIHFDGHSRFGKMCKCLKMNSPDVNECISCGNEIQSPASSYFEFEHNDKQADYVNVDDLISLIIKRLYDHPVCLMVFTSCDSAKIHNQYFEKSIAPSLIKAGAPYVVAMQGKVLSSAMEVFVKSFYAGILSGKGVLESVGQSRIEMGRDEFVPAWFMPVVYSDKSQDKCLINKTQKDK